MSKHISDIINTKLIPKSVEKKDKYIDSATIAIVEELFKRLEGIFSSMKTPMFKNTVNATKREWIIGFIDNNINSTQQLECALQQCRLSGLDFLPSIGQFIKWCMPTNEAMGVPTLEAAYVEACKNSYPGCEKSWSHKLVQHAWKLTGNFFLSNSPRSATYPVFQRNYEIAIRDWRAGKPIEEIHPPLALEKILDPEKNDEKNRKAMYDCYMSLGRDDLASKYAPGDILNQK